MSIPVPARRLSWAGAIVLVAVLAVLAALLVSRSSPPSSPSSSPAGAAQTPGAVETSTSPQPRNASLKPVPVRPVRTLAAVPMDEPADFGTGVRLVVTGVEAVQGKARGPGEIAGPGVRIDLELVNASGEAISLDHVVVALEHGPDRVPASPLVGPPTRALRGRLEAGGTQRATYVYSVPPTGHDDLRIVASYTGEAPSVALVGGVG